MRLFASSRPRRLNDKNAELIKISEQFLAEVNDGIGLETASLKYKTGE